MRSHQPRRCDLSWCDTHCGMWMMDALHTCRRGRHYGTILLGLGLLTYSRTIPIFELGLHFDLTTQLPCTLHVCIPKQLQLVV